MMKELPEVHAEVPTEEEGSAAGEKGLEVDVEGNEEPDQEDEREGEVGELPGEED